jgi:hypothetical protein
MNYAYGKILSPKEFIIVFFYEGLKDITVVTGRKTQDLFCLK